MAAESAQVSKQSHKGRVFSQFVGPQQYEMYDNITSHLVTVVYFIAVSCYSLSLQSVVDNDPFVVQQRRICKTFGSMSVQTVRAAAQNQQHTSNDVLPAYKETTANLC